MDSDQNLRIVKESQIALAEHNVEFKSIDSKLGSINSSLQTLISKLDSLQNQLNTTATQVVEIQTWKKVMSLDEKLDNVVEHSRVLAVLDEKLKDYDKVKSTVEDLKQGQTKFTVYVSIAAFAISIVSTVLIKILVH